VFDFRHKLELRVLVSYDQRYGRVDLIVGAGLWQNILGLFAR